MSDTDYDRIAGRLHQLGVSVFLDLDATEIPPSFWIGEAGGEHVAAARAAVAELLEWRQRQEPRPDAQGLFQQQAATWDDVR